MANHQSVPFPLNVCQDAQAAVIDKDEKKVEVFGQYEVLERIGVGGMASVHRAKKQGIEGFKRVVALKRMLSHLADDQSFIKSFVREARLASQLQHANIIQIYDLGQVGRVYYIAMEFVRGRDLRKILKQNAYATGPMPIPMMLTIARQLCDALDYAHRQTDESGEPLGIVHRDISPSNLLIAADGHLKIIDFGIAKATSNSLRTLSGRVKGKFAYMAPESIQGKTLDNRSDLFAVGIVAYEMLTARPLFASRNQFETVRKITQEEVEPPSRLNPQCPPELDEIVLTALAKTPEERWQSAGAMYQALDHVAKRHGLQATTREIAEWIEWAFQQPLRSKRVAAPTEPTHPNPHQPSRSPSAQPLKQPVKTPVLQPQGPVRVDNVDPASVEIVWGSKGSGGRNGGQRDSASNRVAMGTPASSSAAMSSAGVAAGSNVATPREAIPRAIGDPGSQPSPYAHGTGDASQPVLGPRNPDDSQPQRQLSHAGDRHTGATPVTPAASGTSAAHQAAPNDPSGQGIGHSTMLGLAPPPEQPWRQPSGSSSQHRHVSATPRDESGATPMPQVHGSHTRPSNQRHTARMPTGSSTEADETQWMMRGLRVALIAIVCIAAVLGGYWLVMTIGFGTDTPP